MMWQKVVMIGIVVAFSVVPLTASSWVSCEQQDLEGTWDVSACGDTDCFGDHCLDCSQLQIGSDGIIQNTGATIETRCGTLTVTSGQLTLSSDCVITGTIETSSRTLFVDTGAIVGNDLSLKVSE
jgi:hypothetical protein